MQRADCALASGYPALVDFETSSLIATACLVGSQHIYYEDTDIGTCELVVMADMAIADKGCWRSGEMNGLDGRFWFFVIEFCMQN